MPLAFGSDLYKNGIISDVVFSMNPMKPLGGYGENGAIVTNNYDIYKKIKLLRHAKYFVRSSKEKK